MTADLSRLSMEDWKRIARTARRDIRSERVLILTAGFALAMVVLFFFGPHTVLPVALVIGVRPMIVWIVLSLVVAALGAASHAVRAGPQIAKARKLNAKLLYENDPTYRPDGR